MNWYIEVLKKYIVLEGRASRAEFWYFFLVHVIIMLVLSTIDYALWGALFDTFLLDITADPDNFSVQALMRGSWDFDPLSSLYSLGTLLPVLAVTARRLHDTNHSAWWILIAILPIVGFIVLVIFTATRGDKGANRFGPDPQKSGSKTKSTRKSAYTRKPAATRKATTTRKPRSTSSN